MELTNIPTIITPATDAVLKPENSPKRKRSTPKKAVPHPAGQPIILPEDIVTLSTDVKPDAVLKPSKPVTAEEKVALLGPNSDQYGYSVYV